MAAPCCSSGRGKKEQRVGSSRALIPQSGALPLCVLLRTLLVRVVGGCVCNHGSTKICCGQSADQGRDHCVEAAGRQCPADEPTCTDYVLNGHVGTCTGSAGDECEAGMIGTGLNCPMYTDLPGGCLARAHANARPIRRRNSINFRGVL